MTRNLKIKIAVTFALTAIAFFALGFWSATEILSGYVREILQTQF